MRTTLQSSFNLKALGNKVTHGDLEAIDLSQFFDPADPTPLLLREVIMTSDEVTAVCPVTGQPDQYTVSITFIVKTKILESKSLKLYFQQFRNTGIFAEGLANRICKDIAECIEPLYCGVEVEQKSRGGITLVARATSSG